MQDLKAACQAIRENAEANCSACKWLADVRAGKNLLYRNISPSHLEYLTEQQKDRHTCHATIEAAAEFGDELLDSISCICDGQDDKNAARTTINRLLKEAKK